MLKGLRKFGGCSRTRTCDPLIKSQLLYQLSYAPTAAALYSKARMACRYPTPDSFQIVDGSRTAILRLPSVTKRGAAHAAFALATIVDSA